VHPPLSPGRAENTIMTECTQICGHRQSIVHTLSTVVLPLTLLRVHISLEPGYWRPAVPMTFPFQPNALNTSPPSYRHNTGIHLSFNISSDVNNPPVSLLASTAGRLIALALLLSVFESLVRKSGLLGPPMNHHENHVLSKFIEHVVPYSIYAVTIVPMDSAGSDPDIRFRQCFGSGLI
jgi:hypothetical protein